MEVSSLGPTCFVCALHPKHVVHSVTVLPSSSHGCGWPRVTAIASVVLGASWGSLAHSSLEGISYLALGVLVKDLWLLGPVLSCHAWYLYTFFKNQLNLLITYNVVGFCIGFFLILSFGWPSPTPSLLHILPRSLSPFDPFQPQCRPILLPSRLGFIIPPLKSSLPPPPQLITPFLLLAPTDTHSNTEI